MEKHQDQRLGRYLLKYLLVPLMLAVALAVTTHTFFGRAYEIPSGSMEPTLHGCPGCDNDRVFAEKVSYWGDKSPQRYDIVVFTAPESWAEDPYKRERNAVEEFLHTALGVVGVVAPDCVTFVKRVIATEGETVQCLPGDPGVLVDGELVDDSFTLHEVRVSDTATTSDACNGPYFGPVVVPPGRLWVMGDNRSDSLDSRFHQDDHDGTIAASSVRGKVKAVIGPWDRMRLNP